MIAYSPPKKQGHGQRSNKPTWNIRIIIFRGKFSLFFPIEINSQRRLKNFGDETDHKQRQAKEISKYHRPK